MVSSDCAHGDETDCEGNSTELRVDREEALKSAYVETNRVSPLDPTSLKSWLGLEAPDSRVTKDALEDVHVETNRVSPLDPTSLKSWLGIK
jgi:hypothetical protein